MNLRRNSGTGIPGNRRAFTVIELLASLAAAALLCCLILPVLARARQSPQAAQCLSNHKQLMLAALMYADDNGGLWFPNQPTAQAGQKDWVTDVLNFTPGNTNNYDIRVLTNPGTDFFASYIKSPRIFHCPGDYSRTSDGPRIRSVSANSAVGTLWAPVICFKAGDPVTAIWLSGTGNDCDTTWRRYGKTSDMVSPSPSLLWGFIDEHVNGLNDSEFEMQLTLTNIGAPWVAIPASYHNGAVSISFADGHVELHKWVGFSVPNVPAIWANQDFPNAPVAGNANDVKDIRWLQQRTSALNH